ncbi:ABC transporter permease [Gordonia sp. VNK1]|jgi:peptide/nickel transport system permease protein|uniref:ABC transporter permease n=1 Tax=Gordonia oleivorans TaxID=3156618 RepID=UPI0032B5C061
MSEQSAPSSVSSASSWSWPVWRARPDAIGVWLRRNATTVLSVAVIALALGFAVVPSVFADGDPLLAVPADKLRAPSAEHWFGTDNLGRDVYTRFVHGAALSLTATVSAVAIALAIGALLGLIAGTAGDLTDGVIMRAIDVMLAIPQLLLALAIIAALGFGTTKVAIAVAVVLIAGFARVMRAEVLRVRHAPYVEAARAFGVPRPVILGRHVLRNSYAPVLALAAAEFGMAILLISSLSFLGFGATPPAPEWGSLISEGRNYLATAWWMTTLPGLAIVAVVLAAHTIGHRIAEGEQR